MNPTSRGITDDPLPEFSPQDWAKTTMLGIAPVMNTADLPRPDGDQTVPGASGYPNCLARDQTKLADPDMFYINSASWIGR